MTNSITIGICTFNRKEILIQSANSLHKVNHLDSVNIRIYDDCSFEFDEKFLLALFPEAKSIIRQKQNFGADKNMSLMYEDFLKSGDDWLFNADSDLIYRKDLIEEINECIKNDLRIVSLFNCINHSTIKQGDKFDEKDSVGAAGCLIHRDIIKLILESIKYRNRSFDVEYCKFLRKEGYKLLVTKNSYVQHIGISGFNSRELFFDYGLNFKCDSIDNANSIEQAFEKYVHSVFNYRKKKSWKIYNSIVSFPRRVKRFLFILKDKIVNNFITHE